MEASDALEQSGAARTEPSDPMLALITCEPPDKMAVINVLIVLQSLLSSSVDAAASFNSLGENDTALKHRTQVVRLAVRLAVACNHGSTQLEQLIVRRLEDERWPETFDDFGDSRGTSVYVMVRELRKMLIQELQKDESGLLRVSDAVNDGSPRPSRRRARSLALRSSSCPPGRRGSSSSSPPSSPRSRSRRPPPRCPSMPPPPYPT